MCETRSARVSLPFHEQIEDTALRLAVRLLDSGDAEGLREHLQSRPGLARLHARFDGGNYFEKPTLLEFIAENPVRHGTLPGNIVDIAKMILKAGVEPSSLNTTSSRSRPGGWRESARSRFS